jgi:hypothetical protein
MLKESTPNLVAAMISSNVQQQTLITFLQTVKNAVEKHAHLLTGK